MPSEATGSRNENRKAQEFRGRTGVLQARGPEKKGGQTQGEGEDETRRSFGKGKHFEGRESNGRKKGIKRMK